MTLTRIQPPGIVEIPGLTQVIVATGTRQVFIAGQTPIGADGALVGEGDLAVQARTVFEHLVGCLEAAGATPEDLVRMTIYIVGYDASSLDALYGAAAEVFGDDLPVPTSTLLGVAALFAPGQLIEIDAVAVLA